LPRHLSILENSGFPHKSCESRARSRCPHAPLLPAFEAAFRPRALWWYASGAGDSVVAGAARKPARRAS
jgi:hypothetical protein